MALKSVTCNYDTLIFCSTSLIFFLHVSEIDRQARPRVGFSLRKLHNYGRGYKNLKKNLTIVFFRALHIFCEWYIGSLLKLSNWLKQWCLYIELYMKQYYCILRFSQSNDIKCWREVLGTLNLPSELPIKSASSTQKL